MPHSMLITALDAAVTESRNAGDPLVFLSRLEPLHDNWHRRTFAARGLGFLVFHWHAIEALRHSRAVELWSRPIRAFTRQDFRDMGWPYEVTVRARADDVDSLAAVSMAIERWHNDAHMAVGTAFGIADEMMSPRVNIYYREFWRLHYFINARFTQQLGRFDQTGSMRRKIDQLSTEYHAELYRI